MHSVYGWFSPDVIATMLIHRTKEKKVFWEFDSIIMQNMSHYLLLLCTATWLSYQVIENHLYTMMFWVELSTQLLAFMLKL